MKEYKVTDLRLEKFLLGELSAKEMKDVEKLLKEDASVNKRLQVLKASNSEILETYKPSEMARNIENRVRKYNADSVTTQKSFFRRVLNRLPIITGVAATVVMIPLLVITVFFGGFGNIDRLKGKDNLFIYRKTTSGEEVLKDGDFAKQGDVLQLAYLAGGKRFGAIFSIDGKGNLTWHFPASMQEDTKLEPGKKTLLTESYELDNAPVFERFFFITSGNKLVLSNIVKTASILAKTPDASAEQSKELFGGDRVIIITLKKGE